jgi:uncharacterized OB-fold protein
MRRLKERCNSCGKAVDPAWRLCPYCEAETGVAPPSTRRRRRGSTTSEEPVAERPVAERPPRSSTSR